MQNNLSKKSKALNITAIIVAAALVVFVFCGRYFNSFVKHIANFFVGSFGMAFYGIMAAVIVFCGFALAGKKVRIPVKYLINFILLFVTVVLFVHTLTTQFMQGYKYADYVKYVYDYYGAVPTMGGVVFGSIAFALQSVLSLVGAIIVYVGLLVGTVFMIGDFFYCLTTGKLSLNAPSEKEITPTTEETTEQVVAPITYTPTGDAQTDRQRAWSILHPADTEESVNPVQVAGPQQQPSVEPTTQQQQQTNYNPTPTSGGNAQQRAMETLFPREVVDGGYDNTQNGNNFFDNGGIERNTQQNIDARPTVNGEDYFSTNTPQQPWQQPQQTTGWQATPQRSTMQDNSDGWRLADQTPTQPTVEPSYTPQPTQQQSWQQTTQQTTWQTPVSQQPVNPAPQPVQPQVKPTPAPTPVAPQETYTYNNVQQPTNPATSYDTNGYTDVTDSMPHNDYPSADDLDIVDAVADQMDDYTTLPANDMTRPVAVDVQPTQEPTPTPTPVAPAPQPQPVAPQQPTTPQTPTKTTTSDSGKEKKPFKYSPYVKPPFELLEAPEPFVDVEAADRQAAAEAIVKKLAVFNIQVELVNIVVGPAFSRYMFRVLSQKTRMSDFAKYSDDIKGCLEAPENIRIIAPVTGTNFVGVEVANKKKSKVALRTLLESRDFQEAKGALVFAVGKELSGKVVWKDLAKMPHLLIAGQTGSGKSVCVNCLIVSMLYKYGPEYVRFLMVDPKLVELSRYNGIPHMLTTETITKVNDALAGMDYLINEMESRYQLFKSSGVGDIGEYNKRVNTNEKPKLPYLVFIVDELADLMAVSKQAFENKLGRLAAKARAAGIHIVLATQRPDTKVITGTIKSNLTARIALTVPTFTDSGTILGCGGAEKLLGRGDMLFSDPSAPDLERIQGAYVDNDEIRNVVEFARSQNESHFDEDTAKEIFVTAAQEEAAQREAEAAEEAAANKETQVDPFCKRALRFWLEKNGGKASIASIQRNLAIGFNRAGRIVAQLQNLRYIEEPAASETNSKPLKVLVTLEQLDELFPDQEG